VITAPGNIPALLTPTASYTDDAGTSYSTSFVFYVAIANPL
jgi:hypothetical protein